MPDTDPPQPDSFFRFDASVILQLGESLITDEYQAIIELIKNSYDAKARFCEIKVDTTSNPPAPTHFPDAVGFLTIKDDGVGMTKADILQNWLTVSFSPKRVLKAKGAVAEDERMPLGDKGLGRLGVQRIGENVDLWSRAEGKTPAAVHYSWKPFRESRTVDEVKIPVDEITDAEASLTVKKRGTQLTISDLKLAQKGQETWVNNLKVALSELISPFEPIPKFSVSLEVNGNPESLFKVDEEEKAQALVKYAFKFDGERLTMKGLARLAYASSRADDEELMSELLYKNKGRAFVEFLSVYSARAQAVNFEHSTTAPWHVQFSRVIPFEDLTDGSLGGNSNPGPFEGEILYYAIRDATDAFRDTFGAGTRAAIKKLSGVRIYRDGFQIRMDTDWLNLASQVTGGQSWYGLRPENTIGYVKITARNNAQLEEVTDREGFKATTAYLNFRAMMQELVSFSQDAQTAFRRGWQEFKGSSGKVPPENETPAKRARKLKKKVEALGKKATIEDIEELREEAIFLETYLEDLEEKYGEMVELASLGLSSEALSHELMNAVDKILEEIKAIETVFKKLNSQDRNLARVKSLRSSMTTLRKQISYLSPALKYVRERKEDIEISDLVTKFADFWRQRLGDAKIDIELVVDATTPPGKIRANQGRVIQVLDNLLLNSEYWIKKAQNAGKLERGHIMITVIGEEVHVEDNGPGIDPIVERSLFEPFVTRKPKTEGRGLGLYIARQLLSKMGATIELLPNRNANGRRHIFAIDFGEAAI